MMTVPDLSDLMRRVREGGGEDRFMALVEPDTNGGCWLWNGSAQGAGNRQRGTFCFGGHQMLAHRWSMVLIGLDPAGHFVCHKCDTPMCVNPAHLYLGDHASNMRDMSRRRRSFGATQPERAKAMARRLGLINTWTRGAGNPKAKLSPTQAAAIQRDRRVTRVVAQEYGVHRTTIQRIRRGALWPSTALSEQSK